MDANQSVKELYEHFPYPRADENLAPFLERKMIPAWNPRDSFALFFPDQPFREDLDILIAGCGTNTAQQHAACMPNARIVGVDISSSSLAHAQKVIDSFGLKNVELIQLPLEKVETLGRTFDLVHCQGVLHHLESPSAGLHALAKVTRPTGALSLMLYATYGRAGVYMLQELFRDRLGLAVSEADLSRVQTATQMLPAGHPFKAVHAKSGERIALEELADLLLHPRDIAYTVGDVKRLVDDSGLLFQRWMGQAQYTPEVSPFQEFAPEFARMDFWQKSAAMELFYGKLITHQFVLSHPGRPTPGDLFAIDKMPRAVPILSPHLRVTHAGGEVELVHSQHQVPFRVTLPLTGEAAFLKHVDGSRTVAQIVEAAAPANQRYAAQKLANGFFHELYLADMVELRAS